MATTVHDSGHPDFCGPACDGPHTDDGAPEVCEQCGGNGRACFFGCIEKRNHRYEPWEGRTAAQEAYDADEFLL